MLSTLTLSVLLPLLSPAPVADEPVVLFVGDSLTAGYGLLPEQAFPARIQERIDAADLDFEVVNAGVSGETSAGGLRRIDWLLQRKIAVLVLELGANDGLRGVDPEQTRANLQAIIDRVRSRYPDVAVVIAGMRVPPNLGRDYGEEFRAIFPELARRNDAVLVPFLLEGVGGRPELNLPDGIHPTAEGHRIVAENVWEVLEPVLREHASEGNDGGRRKKPSRAPLSRAQPPLTWEPGTISSTSPSRNRTQHFVPSS